MSRTRDIQLNRRSFVLGSLMLGAANRRPASAGFVRNPSSNSMGSSLTSTGGIAVSGSCTSSQYASAAATCPACCASIA